MRAILIKMGILVIALAMVVGVATAAPADVRITPESATIPYEPDYVTYNVDVYDILDPQYERVIQPSVFPQDTSGSATDLRFRFTNSTASSPWLSSGDTWNWGKPQTQNTYPCLGDPTKSCGYENLTMDVNATSSAPGNIEYEIKVEDITTGPPEAWDTAYGGTWGTSIPEFATIAIPVATILGLLFFFNHRKRRKE